MSKRKLDELARLVSRVMTQVEPVGDSCIAQLSIAEGHATYQVNIYDKVVDKESFGGPMRVLDPSNLDGELWFDLVSGKTAVLYASRKGRTYLQAVPRASYRLVFGTCYGLNRPMYDLKQIIRQSPLRQLI